MHATPHPARPTTTSNTSSTSTTPGTHEAPDSRGTRSSSTPRIRLPARLRAGLRRAALVTLGTLTALTGLTAPASSSPPTARPADPPPLYVALGDSYSAGSFIRPWEIDGCGRSFHNYPSQAARRLHLRLTDVTCSGAEARAGILAPLPSPAGPPSAPPASGWAPRPAQIDSVAADAAWVSVGIGGNSIGFADIVRRCVESGLRSLGSGSPCTMYYDRGAPRTDLDARFTTLGTDLGTIIDRVRARAPRAKVLVVGYPAIVPDAKGCAWGDWSRMGTITTGDLPWLDRQERRLNTLLRDTAAAGGATYVDTYTGSTAHGVCAPDTDRWMYGIKDRLTGTGDQTDPPTDQCSLVSHPDETCTFIHPNLRGATHQADTVTTALTGLGARPNPGGA
ncbi:SGNH/GDSL hydrolase family protein [Streptomyces sp. BI20]|uniref:SGNH/GDSL hydrolase family protein n=1 Tax=Streptomyces sp. BI20 TaxID=3403460 RepID=UPI003C728885